MLQQIKTIVDTGADITCMDVHLISMQVITTQGKLQTEYVSALKRRLDDLDVCKKCVC